MFSINDYDYDLPQHLVAQFPAARKDASRLLRLDRRTGGVSHHRFCELVDLLSPDDLVVINNTEVIPARILGKKETGGRVEALILDYPGVREPTGTTVCSCLMKNAQRLQAGMQIVFEEVWPAEVLSGENGLYRLRLAADFELDPFLRWKGRVPLPPYIHRDDPGAPCDDKTCYQTVYAAEKGAVAAPTAGLHFTLAMMNELKDKGVTVAPLTLHVGIGTFMPVRVTDIREHRMHRERFTLCRETARAINRARSTGGRVVAVGTTVVRTLEYIYRNQGAISESAGESDLFIYPGFRFGVVDALITNFHLPRSTLLMLVAAFAGRERILAAYQIAVAQEYRFFSYGDAMFIA